jgi:hypothetical protein
MHDLEQRIRRAIPPVAAPDGNDATWRDVQDQMARSAASPVRPRRRRRRIAMIAVAACLVVSGVAVAAEPALLERLFPKGSDADRMEAIREQPANVPRAEAYATSEEIFSAMRDGQAARIPGHQVLLQHRAGDVATTLHAFPTDGGDVCYYWEGSFGSGSCGGAAFGPDDVVSATPSYYGIEGRWASVTSITGLTTDAVTDVRVRLADGTIQDTVMGRNSFLWYPRPNLDLMKYVASMGGAKKAPPPARAEPIALDVELVDGNMERVEIPAS